MPPDITFSKHPPCLQNSLLLSETHEKLKFLLSKTHEKLKLLLEIPLKKQQVMLEARMISLSFSLDHKHSAVTDLWNDTEVILNLTNESPILCFYISSGSVQFCIHVSDEWGKQKKCVCVPATTPWENSHTVYVH